MKSRKYYLPIGLFYSALNKALDKYCLNIYSQNLRPIEQIVKKIRIVIVTQIIC